jgi:hypothetical protein
MATRKGIKLDEGWRFLIGLPLVICSLAGGYQLFVHGETGAAERSVEILFPIGLAPKASSSLLESKAADTVRLLNKQYGTVVTTRRSVIGAEPFGPCLVELTLSNGKASFHFLAYFYHGICSRIDPDLVDQAAELTGIREKTALIHEGFKALIERESAKRLAILGGSMPDLDPVRRRQSA